MTVSFVRYVQPQRATAPVMPGGLFSSGESGKVQTRGTQQVGRSWEESYAPFKNSDLNNRALYAQVENLFRNSTRFLIEHNLYRFLIGAGGGTPTVNGANQTGTSLITHGWPNTTTVLRAGDVLTIASLPLVYDVVANAVSDGSGNATIQINPPIFSGGSPANGAALTLNAVNG
jgi:hypothetical protein